MSILIKERIKKNFSKIAPLYDEYAHIQMEVASRLISQIKGMDFSNILEIGCGSGNYTLMLRKAFPMARIMAVDFAPGMLKVASSKLKDQGIEFILADGEGIFADYKNGFDLITSNVSFQWFNDLKAAIKVYQDLLKEGGAISFSIFGPDTFSELKEVYCQLFPERRLSAEHFLDKEALKEILEDSFQDVKIEEITFTERYSNLKELLRTIKYTGGNGLSPEKGLFFTPDKVKRIEDTYFERFGGIQASYQLFFCQGYRQ